MNARVVITCDELLEPKDAICNFCLSVAISGWNVKLQVDFNTNYFTYLVADACFLTKKSKIKIVTVQFALKNKIFVATLAW